jgi:flagellin-like hook-associated protein FlgL
MRVTEQQTFGVLANELQRSRARLLALQQQVSTGKAILQPSDDPSAYNHIALDKASIAAIDQRMRNITFGQTRLDLSDKVLSSSTDVLSRIRELAVQFGNDTNGPAERAIGAREIRQLLAQVQLFANTELNGQAIFAGTSTHGRMTGITIATPVTLTNGSNDTLIVSVDGVTSGTIDLTSGSATLTGTEVASLVQSRINADAVLNNAGKQVSVTFETDHLVIASDYYGAASTVAVTGGSARTVLGLAGGSSTTGTGPFALTASISGASGNTGGVLAGAGRIADDNLVTLDDYVIRFTSATAYDVLDVTVPPSITRGGANSGAAAVTDAGIANASQLKLHTYQIQFTSPTQYSVVDTTAGTTLSSGNAYVSGNQIAFDGLRITVANGQQGGPQAGDTFTVSLAPRTVLANQTYMSGSEISFDGIRVTLANGTGAPAAGDLFAVMTGVGYQGDSGVHSIEVGNDQTVATNVSGDRIFTPASADLFATVKDLVTSLRTNERGGVARSLGGIDRSLAAIGAVHGEIGALSNRLTTSSAQLEEAKGFFTQTLSKTEDIDLAKAISDLTLQQFALEAASRTLTKVFENSLLNYL